MRCAPSGQLSSCATPSLPGETVAIGIDSGEVLTGDRGSGEPLVTGDAVEAAASSAVGRGPGEIVIGKETHGLVRDAVRVGTAQGTGTRW